MVISRRSLGKEGVIDKIKKDDGRGCSLDRIRNYNYWNPQGPFVPPKINPNLISLIVYKGKDELDNPIFKTKPIKDPGYTKKQRT